MVTNDVIMVVFLYITTRGGDFLLRVGDEQFSQNTQFILNWATFVAQAGIFDTEWPDLLTGLPLYDQMIVKTEWKACGNGQLAKTLGLQGASSKIIKETIRNGRVARKHLDIFGKYYPPPPLPQISTPDNHCSNSNYYTTPK